jgi:hypothetical protein
MMDSEAEKKSEASKVGIRQRVMVVRSAVVAFVLLCAAFFGFFYSNSAAREPKRFDAGDDWGRVRSTDVLVGSYPIETVEGKKFAWIGPTAKIALPFIGSEKSLNITGWFPLDQHRIRNGVTELRVEVLAGGHKLGELRSDKQEAFEQSFSLAGVSRGQDGNLIVELKSSSVLAPTQSDQRSLSIVINKIWLE